MDQLAAIFDKISLSAREVYSGTLCGESKFDQSLGLGCLHLIRGNKLEVLLPNQKSMMVEEPSILFFPRPYEHGFRCFDGETVELACALVEFARGLDNPLINALPDVILIPFSSSTEIEQAVTVLFAEAFKNNAGRQAALDRLHEYVLILLLRQLIDAKLLESGILAGLADDKLSRAIVLINENPDIEYNLEDLARVAGMSRARFASHFKRIVGMTVFNYLYDLRLSIATSLIRSGMPMTIVSNTVGYKNSAAFTRAFTKKMGISPRAWLKVDRAQTKGCNC